MCVSISITSAAQRRMLWAHLWGVQFMTCKFTASFSFIKVNFPSCNVSVGVSPLVTLRRKGLFAGKCGIWWLMYLLYADRPQRPCGIAMWQISSPHTPASTLTLISQSRHTSGWTVCDTLKSVSHGSSPTALFVSCATCHFVQPCIIYMTRYIWG